MQTNREHLIEAIATVKRGKANPTEEDVARKLDISVAQLRAYIDGADVPAFDLGHRLMAAYRIGIVMARVSLTSTPRQTGERKPISLEGMIRLVTEKAMVASVPLGKEDIERKLGLPEGRLDFYLNHQEDSPEDLPGRLWQACEDLLDSARMVESRQSLEREIVFIRNHGLKLGMDITLDEMLEKIDLPKERFYAYLEGAYKTQEDFSWKLKQAYQDLMENVRIVHLKEDLHFILSNDKNDSV